MTENDLVAQTTDGQRRSDRGPKTDVRFSRVRLSRNSSVFDGPPDVPNQSGSMGREGGEGEIKITFAASAFVFREIFPNPESPSM